MRWLASLPVLLLSLGSASAAGPLDGKWAWDKDVCANERGSGDLVPSIYDGDTISHYESQCTIAKITPIGSMDSAWEVEMTCAGEGEEWSGKAIFAIERDVDGNPHQMIEINLDDGMVIVRQHCD